jgi:uncharacterized protein (TIGR00369 family)
MNDRPTANAERILTMSGKPSGFRSLLGYRTIRWEQGYAEIEQPLGLQHMNSLGFTHGGLYLTILDAVLGHAVTWCAVPGNVRGCVTISLTTSFLSPARHGTIRAIGHLEDSHNRIATATGKVIGGNGELFATAQGSFRYFAGSELVEGVARLPGPEQ